jgi:hypothetical protein
MPFDSSISEWLKFQAGFPENNESAHFETRLQKVTS